MSVEPPDLPSEPPPPALNEPEPEVAAGEPVVVPRRRRRRLLTVAVALVLATAVPAGVLVTLDVREERAQAAAAEKEHQAYEAYRKALLPVVVRVHDGVQPLQDAVDAFRKPRFGMHTAYDDVVLHGGAVEELRKATKAFEAIPVPRSAEKEAAALRSTLGRLTSSITALARLTKSSRDQYGYRKGTSDAELRLRQAQGYWASAVQAFDPERRWPVPSPYRAQSQNRAIATRASFIHASDLACAGVTTAVAGLPELSPEQDLMRNMPKRTVAYRKALLALARVKEPRGATAFRDGLVVHLRSATEATRTLDRLSEALRDRDRQAFTAAQLDFRASLASLRELSEQYRKVGATMCRQLFEVPDDEPKKPTRRT